VTGYGGGVGLVAACDIAVGTPAVGFSLSEVKLGLTPATISPYVLRAIGERAARRYFVTAERFDAAQAHHLGLLHEVVEPEVLDATVDRLVQAIVANGPLAVRAGKRLISEVAGQPVTPPCATTPRATLPTSAPAKKAAPACTPS
jgi:methylglutaconyl-CoA hydratase